MRRHTQGVCNSDETNIWQCYLPNSVSIVLSRKGSNSINIMVSYADTFKQNKHPNNSYLPPPNGDCYIFNSVGLSVCLWTILPKTREQTFMKCSGKVGHDIRNNLENLWNGTVNPFSTGFLLLCFRGNPCPLATLRENG